MTFWMLVAVSAMTTVSLLLHHSNNKKLNALADVLDELRGAAQTVGKTP